MTHASITALALEESLLSQWSDFYSIIEPLRGAPSTREAAELLAGYSRDHVFVDSVLDALNLHLAGKGAFDAKFGSYLELMLIQRARSEDIVVLHQLAEKCARDADINGLTGLRYRLQLYGGDERLTALADFCSAALRHLDAPLDNATWAAAVGIEPTSEAWNVGLRLGTAPPNYWVARRDELKRDDVSLELLVANSREWRIQVARVDRHYSAQWRPSGITVATEDLKYKSLHAWPSVASPRLFPDFAMRLGDYLQIGWLRLAWITSQDVQVNKPQLLDWLYCCADEIRP